ncbi:macrolide ABC transporter ATP-binding protein [Kosmotoga arenicorallina S304]|uniref:Macrolide ABC transporter ATP-binding protein n=1 Tax=Kosmotoga arenicorallina S304 TaxID=1453497 RepID=A0A176JUS2_9BACT|nr:ABC transporter ATP-binding protein [Kosmotoga arenicorallina]OAA27199.1 macrolide ABC transporter ATP-binding protein [Kosmotoga arenicorallina S304]
MAIVVAKKLRKIYNSGEVQVEALKSVDLEIEEGEILAIIGPSGCGKSTLLNCLSGIDDLTSGEVIVNDRPLNEMNDNQKTRFRAENMGFVFQFYNLIPVLTTVENIELPLLTIGYSLKDARKQALDILKRLGIYERANYLPSRLSGGERQRVAIGRALVHKPKIVWADEPTGALDTESSKALMNLIVELNEKYGQTFVIVTHDERIASYANRVAHMDSGEIISIKKLEARQR